MHEAPVMKTSIYYFTGTGNSLAVAQGLCTRLGDCTLIPIASLAGTAGGIAPDADRVGIVCPVYFLGIPALVARFAGRLDLTHAGYTFAVLTMGGSGGSSALHQLDAILRTRSARGLDAGFAVRMPGNYVLMYASPAGKKREEILDRADRDIAAIAGTIGAGLRPKLPYSFFAALIHHLMYPRFISSAPGNDRKFSVDERCTSCGICAKVCPVDNITLVQGRPVWAHRCEQCMACIHLCPTEAIQAGRKTAARGRYRHPSVPVDDLIRQKRAS
jgi:ferredoxin